MDAAVTLFAERGVEKTSVLDITNAAGVANGTFYNYFANKQKIVDAVYETVAAALRSSMDIKIEAVEDGPSQVALGTMWLIEATTVDPHWGSMTINALQVGMPFHAWIASSSEKAISRGFRQGHFAVPPCEILVEYTVAVVVSAIRRRLAEPGAHRERIAIVAAESLLRMLGMTTQDAARVVDRVRHTFDVLPSLQPPKIELNSPRHARLGEAMVKV